MCGKRIPGYSFACKPHWDALPQPYQRTLWRAFSDWGAGYMTTPQLRAIQREVLRQIAEIPGNEGFATRLNRPL